MEIKGKVIQILEPKSGQSTRGGWKKQELVIETYESFPKKVCMASWNDKVDLSSIRPGDEITASINIESREYNGNWYTDVKLWKIDFSSAGSAGTAAELPGAGFPKDVPPPPWESDPGELSNDLPF